MTRLVTAIAVVVLTLLLAGCGESSDSSAKSTPSADGKQRFPDVVGVKVNKSGGTYTFDVTISSPYDTPERYADGWQVIGPDGEAYGTHPLGHDHAGEQPFTRTQTGVKIPEKVTEVTIQGRDKKYGYGGKTKTVQLPR